ncbi:MAG: phosphoribosylglycinamide formyltransferase [Desulfobacteraceae bacterium]|nr:MAG: phosphoribosylglycinamide formyltransferase [Desulfobacteraceae bacterium]
MGNRIRIGALISGGGTNLQAIIDSCESGKVDGKIVFVGTDNPDAKGLARASKHNIPTFVVDYSSIIRQYGKDPGAISLPGDFEMQDILSRISLFPSGADSKKKEKFVVTRAIAEALLIEKMKPYPFDLLVLAGFMRNFTPYFIDRINTDPDNPRIMNIHPALLPAFPGTDGYGDTFRYGSKTGGCTVHFIDYGEDSGPIIGQKAFQIEPDDTIDSIKKKGLALEWELYPECIRLFAQKCLKTIKMTYTLDDGKEVNRTVVKIMNGEQ